MALIDSPLMFVTDGTDRSLVGLPHVAAFAAHAHWRLTVLHMFDKDEQAERVGRVTDTLASLPVAGEPPSIVAMRSDTLSDALTNGELERRSVLALRLQQRRFLGRLLPANVYKHLPRGWMPPMLMLPTKSDCRPIRRVLFPADLAPRSAPAFDEAVALCEALGAELHVFHVFGDDRLLPADKDMARRQAVRSPRELLDIDRDAIRAMVEQATMRGVHAQAATAEGRAHAHILSYAAASKADMIIMATHGPRSMEDIMLGTTTARVSQGASVPVMSLRTNPVRFNVSTSA